MKKIALTVIITFLAILIGSWLFIESGTYNISQLSPHNGLTKWMINTTTEKSINKRISDIKVPELNDTLKINEGFRHYNEMCVSCHGAPGINQWEMTEGLYPQPPKIYKFDEELDPRETFWVIKNGIKMTSMPAYGPSHDDERIWAITAFVTQKLQKMTPEEYKLWMGKYKADIED